MFGDPKCHYVELEKKADPKNPNIKKSDPKRLVSAAYGTNKNKNRSELIANNNIANIKTLALIGSCLLAANNMVSPNASRKIAMKLTVRSIYAARLFAILLGTNANLMGLKLET